VGDRRNVAGAALAGALVGGLIGYLYLTRDGRELRASVEPTLDELVTEIHHMRAALGKLRAAVAEGRQSLDEAIGRAERAAPEWVKTHRTNAGY